MTDSRSRLEAALADRYRLERELGAGGMATVYLAHDLRHDRKVAVKVLRPELAAVIGAERFLVEIKVTANLQHPHILPLHDSGTADGTVFYVMPYVPGESLRDRLTREKQLPVDDAVRIATEVAGALDYAHRQGVVHRDIKPENILLHDGRALVADFGIALAVSRSDGGIRMTESGMSLGTPHYMSPEQAMGDREITPKADVYALGCVLYELLTGEPPFTGPTAQAILARVMTEDPRRLSQQRHTIPPNVEAAVLTALEKLPADRFATAAEFAAALGNPHFTTAELDVATGPGTMRGLRDNRPALVLGGVALAALVAAAWGWLRPGLVPEVSRYQLGLPKGQALAPGGNFRLAVSPDGRHLVYVGAAPNGTQLWLRSREELDATALVGTQGAINPAFSPDGSRLAFVATGTGRRRALQVISSSGGPAVTLTDSLVDEGGVGWGHDGYVYYDGHLERDGIARVRETGGSPEPVTTPDRARGESWHNQPEPLPNGNGLLFTIARGGAGGGYEIAVADLRTGKHQVLVPGIMPRYAISGHLLYSSVEGALMAAPFDQDAMRLTGEPFVVAEGLAGRGLGRADVGLSRTGLLVYAAGQSLLTSGSELVWVSRDGTALAVDSTWTGQFGTLALSPDGSRVAITMGLAAGQFDAQVWIKRLDRGPASKLTFEGSRNRSPSWMPDGRRVAFLSNARTAKSEVYSGPADGSSMPARFLTTTETVTAVQFSQDGHWVVYALDGDLYAARLTGDTTRRVLVRSGAISENPALAPNGRWLAYVSDESGRREVYVRPFPDTERSKRQVSTRGGITPVWRADGRELFYIDQERAMVAVTVETGPVFTTGPERVLFPAANYLVGPAVNYAVHPDGTRFLMLRPIGVEEAADELIVVENFLADLRARVKR